MPHPTTNETIDAIIETMDPKVWYPFGEKWGPAYKYLLKEQHISTQALRRCLKVMLDNGLLELEAGLSGKSYEVLISTADWNTKVRLSDFGDKIREEGGWIKHWESTKGKKVKAPFHSVVIILELLFVGFGVWLAYKNDVRSDRLEKQELKYVEQAHELEFARKKIDSLLMIIDKGKNPPSHSIGDKK